MWELTRLTSRGGNSTRRIFTYALAAILAVLLSTLLFTTQTHAADTANWTGDSITYAQHQYFPIGKAAKGDSINLPVDTTYYVHVETVNTNPLTQKAYVIYFAPGLDPGKEKSATYVSYDFANKTFSNPQGKVAISIAPKGTTDNLASSCSVTGGLGWIICPVSVFIASGMDWVLQQINTLMVVQPATVGDSNSPLYVAWNLMRSFANIAFIIVFLIIIFSQLGNVGVSNYGIKKLLPRLIVAAILVNISYFICALAIDVSNVVGNSMQGLFDGLRKNVFSITNDTWQASMWSVQSVTEFVLSGGSAAVAGSAALLIATGASITSAIFLLLPALVGLMLAVLVAFLILAGRQAIITVLLIISPLAFVANLLPNTEKWFTKWRELFMTMLVFFPAFALVFAGAQLAGGLIIQNATSINVVILGLIVQLAPLAISPLLLKLSGDLLGKIARLADTPNKMIKDRTQAWGKAHAEDEKYKKFNRMAQRPGLSKFDLAGRAARGLEYRKRRLEKSTEAGKAQYERWATNRDVSSKRGQRLEVNTAIAKLETENTQKDMQQAIEEMRAGDSTGLQRLSARADPKAADYIRKAFTGDNMEAIQERNAARYSQSRSAQKFADRVVKSAVQADQNMRVIQSATHNAQEIQQQLFAKQMLQHEYLQKRAGGIDPEGADAALAVAIYTIREAYGKSIDEARAINKHFNLSSSERQVHALGKQELVKEIEVEVNGEKVKVRRTFKQDNIFTREAAIADQMTTGTAYEAEQLIIASGSEDFKKHGFQTTVSETLGKNPGMQAKMLHLGGQSIDDISQGLIGSKADVDWVAARALARGKLSQQDVTSLDPEGVKEFLAIARDEGGRATAARARLSPTDQDNFDKRIRDFQKVVLDSFTGDARDQIKSGARDDLEKIAQLYDPTFVDPAKR